ncbi:HNH endonuclease [Crossiella sp. CA-258035]|uniref:HNH endonuclease n=1 Tax=Crossiella sp. CA-258035 TaxID=2981138 RepID=UPI0024BC7E64|nr:HNH endonuclease [Crossiella sp. CA-258035]WHT16589.1 HNH endonuclease [Crossiella sp. CA-258035]
MIRITRPPLAAPLAARLDRLTSEIVHAHPEHYQKARQLWRGAAIKTQLRQVLLGMAPGLECCMYCGDSRGSDIDHHEPVKRTPLRTFDWTNHLLACSGCNSHHKGGQFPVDANGKPLLIDPTVDDPFEHLTLSLATGMYVPRTDKGRYTLDVCGLNHSPLPESRVQARRVVCASLRSWQAARIRADHRIMNEDIQTVHGQPHAVVFQSMLRHAQSVNAEIIFSDMPEVLPLLRDPELQAALVI